MRLCYEPFDILWIVPIKIEAEGAQGVLLAIQYGWLTMVPSHETYVLVMHSSVGWGLGPVQSRQRINSAWYLVTSEIGSNKTGLQKSARQFFRARI